MIMVIYDYYYTFLLLWNMLSLKYSREGFVGAFYIIFSNSCDCKWFQNKLYFYKEHLGNDLCMSSWNWDFKFMGINKTTDMSWLS